MPFNGSGTYAAPASSFNPAVATTTINSTDWAALLADLTTALSTAYCKDGQSVPTASLPMGGFKLTGLGAGTGAGNSVRYEQVLLLAGGTMVGDLLFTDATYDIGKTGATRPRDLFMSRNLTVGGTAAVTGHLTVEGVTTAGATGTTNLVFSASPTLTGSPLAPTQTAADNSTKIATTAYVDRGSASAMTLLCPVKTASNSASLSFGTADFDWAAFDEYQFHLVQLRPATNAVNLQQRIMQDGSTPIATSAYNHTILETTNVTAAVTSPAQATSCVLNSTGIPNGADYAVNGVVTIYKPSNTIKKMWQSKIIFLGNAGPSVIDDAVLYYANDTIAINGTQFFFSSGNITSGSIYAYGIRKS